ncbi:MAG TPA: hypothetical protein VFA48_00275 [Gammaproteobacteria bacterium]|nr:hypothetical protein [Gammaproteobacteria bacterium]
MSESGSSEVHLVRDPELSVMMVAGPDATAFLNAQAMTLLLDREENRCIKCAFADNKGRVVAVATAWRSGEAWRFLLPADQAGWLAQHLLRFRFRSRCDIEVIAEYQVCAVFGQGARDALHKAGVPAPEPGRVQGDEALSCVALNADRYVVLGEKDAVDRVADSLEGESRETGGGHWRGVGMRAGDAVVYEASRGRFLPQMLNLDEAEVIDWQKGCYPGQEVIARLQHRGTVKKRLVLIGETLDAAIGERAEVEGIPVEVVDRGILQDGREVTQVVAPYPFDAAIDNLKL